MLFTFRKYIFLEFEKVKVPKNDIVHFVGPLDNRTSMGSCNTFEENLQLVQ